MGMGGLFGSEAERLGWQVKKEGMRRREGRADFLDVMLQGICQDFKIEDNKTDAKKQAWGRLYSASDMGHTIRLTKM